MCSTERRESGNRETLEVHACQEALHTLTVGCRTPPCSPRLRPPSPRRAWRARMLAPSRLPRRLVYALSAAAAACFITLLTCVWCTSWGLRFAQTDYGGGSGDTYGRPLQRRLASFGPPARGGPALWLWNWVDPAGARPECQVPSPARGTADPGLPGARWSASALAAWLGRRRAQPSWCLAGAAVLACAAFVEIEICVREAAVPSSGWGVVVQALRGVADPLHTIAIVGNGPITAYQRQQIEAADAIIRFNKLDNWCAGAAGAALESSRVVTSSCSVCLPQQSMVVSSRVLIHTLPTHSYPLL